MSTKITDIIIPEIHGRYVNKKALESNAFWTSGVVTDDAELAQYLALGGAKVTLPFWQDLGEDEAVRSDSSDLPITKIEAGSQIAIKTFRDKAFGASNLAKELAGADPLAAILDKLAQWKATQRQKRLIATMNGIFAAASMSTNIHDISAEIGADAVITPGSIVDAQGLLGDKQDELVAIAVHSATYTLLKKLQLITEVQPATVGAAPIPYYGKYRVVVDDNLPVADGVYTSYLFAAGAVRFAAGGETVPMETGRQKLTGGGTDYVVIRENSIIHVDGVSFVGAETLPTNATLETGTKWSKVKAAKAIKVVAIKHRIAAA